MMDLHKAITIANFAHAGQVDKAGQPYILHPLRVMLAMETDEERIVAVLHDVVEDTGVSFNDLRRERLNERLLTAIGALTRRDGEPYMPDYMDRVAANALARKVKLADLDDNLSPSRSIPGAGAASRDRRYRAARARLEAARCAS